MEAPVSADNSVTTCRHRRVKVTPLALAAVLAFSVAKPDAFGIRLNLTESQPLGLYQSAPGPLARAGLVAVCLPQNLAIQGRNRGWLRPGDCPGGVAAVLKEVVALPGDFVTVSDAGLSVNGGRIAHTQRQALDSKGRPVEAVSAGFYRVSFGEVWLVANASPRSWDSRYYGPVPLDAIRTPMRPLITWSR